MKLRAAVRLAWQARRFVRIFLRMAGWSGVATVALAVAALGGAVATMRMEMRAAELGHRLAAEGNATESRAVPLVGAAEELETFRAYLPAHDDIPDVVKRLLLLAEDHGLVFASGEYKAEPDEGFVSYRMILPVKGEAAAIQSFLLDALKRHPTLALESVTFRRGRIEAQEVEARLHFSLLTRLPASRSAP